MMDSTKKKRKFVPLKVKLEALKGLDKGETLKKLAFEYGVGEVTVGDRHRSRSKLEVFCSNKCSDVSLDRKSFKKSECENTGKTLFMWFTQQRQKGSPLSGPILKKLCSFKKNLKREIKISQLEYGGLTTRKKIKYSATRDVWREIIC